MTIEHILDGLQYNHNSVFPREALQEALIHKEKIIPYLLNAIIDATKKIKDAENPIHHEAYFFHIYAMFLLAQFREKQAYKIIVDFFSIPGEITLDLTGDVVIENLPQILASVCDGDISLIKQLVENEKANEFVRGSALKSMVVMVAEGQIHRETVLNYLASLFRGKMKHDTSYIWNNLVDVALDLYPDELISDIYKAFDEGLIDRFFVNRDDVKRVMATGKENVLKQLQENQRYKLINDIIAELQWWTCFNEKPTKGHLPADMIKKNDREKKGKHKKKMIKQSRKKNRKRK